MSSMTELTNVESSLPVEIKTGTTQSDESIYHYFREHTAFLVTCVSAMVAITSFILNYAISRYNLAYLQHWGIDPIYAVSNNNQLYVVLCSFMYCLALMAIHALLSGTSDSFRHYNKLLSTLNYQHRHSKKVARQLRKTEHELNKTLQNLSQKERHSSRIEEIQRKIQDTKSEFQNIIDIQQSTSNARKNYRTWLYVNVGVSIGISYMIGMIFVLLTRTTITTKEILYASILVSGIILFDLLIYFFPAYCSTKCTKKRYEKMDMLKFVDDMLDTEKHKFPIEEMLKHGLRSMVSNKKLKLALGQFLTATVVLVFLMTYSGTHAARTKTNFPIYSDDSGVYAVVYNNGQALIMESATIKDNTITIDTNSQRILHSDDIIYEVDIFDLVEIIRDGDS